MYVEKGCTKYTFTKPEEFSQAGELTVTCLHKLNQAYTKVFSPLPGDCYPVLTGVLVSSLKTRWKQPSTDI